MQKPQRGVKYDVIHPPQCSYFLLSFHSFNSVTICRHGFLRAISISAFERFVFFSRYVTLNLTTFDTFIFGDHWQRYVEFRVSFRTPALPYLTSSKMASVCSSWL